MEGTQSLADDFLRDLEELDDDVLIKKRRLDEDYEESELEIHPLAQSQLLANPQIPNFIHVIYI